LGEEHHSAIRRDPSAIERGAHLLARYRWQVNRQRNIIVHNSFPLLDRGAASATGNHAAHSRFGLLPGDLPRRRGHRMKRRELMILLGGAMIAAPALRAQQKAMPVIGYLSAATLVDSADLVAAFRQGLSDAGYVEGQNVLIEYGWAEGHYDRLSGLATDLVRRQVTVIAATSTPVELAAKAATATIPIGFTIGGDPVKFGLVTSLSRPHGNLTGVTRFNVELGPKRLELLHELVPTAARVALLVNPTNPNTETFSRDLQMAADALGLNVDVLQAGAESEFDALFATLVQWRIGALVIANDPFFNSRSEQLAVLTVRHAVPAIYQYRKFVEAGGLMSYGASNTDSHRQLGAYIGRILAGAKPADLPVEQSTKVELLINLKTAKALGLVVPQTILGRADEVIE
jgi:putative tryptophan/tyrosine transport system substrate-binding protein